MKIIIIKSFSWDDTFISDLPVSKTRQMQCYQETDVKNAKVMASLGLFQAYQKRKKLR